MVIWLDNCEASERVSEEIRKDALRCLAEVRGYGALERLAEFQSAPLRDPHNFATTGHPGLSKPVSYCYLCGHRFWYVLHHLELLPPQPAPPLTEAEIAELGRWYA